MMSSLNNFPTYIIPLIAPVVKGKKHIFEKIAFLTLVGSPITVKSFVRFETGEGLEKKEDDFAAEVAAMAGNK